MIQEVSAQRGQLIHDALYSRRIVYGDEKDNNIFRGGSSTENTSAEDVARSRFSKNLTERVSPVVGPFYSLFSSKKKEEDKSGNQSNDKSKSDNNNNNNQKKGE